MLIINGKIKNKTKTMTPAIVHPRSLFLKCSMSSKHPFPHAIAFPLIPKYTLRAIWNTSKMTEKAIPRGEKNIIMTNDKTNKLSTTIDGHQHA